jgi:magnesium-transporting ATPase (P-type)
MVTGDNKTTAEAIADEFDIPKVILSLGCSIISVAFYYLSGYFSLLMPYWLFYVSHVEDSLTI